MIPGISLMGVNGPNNHGVRIDGTSNLLLDFAYFSSPMLPFYTKGEQKASRIFKHAPALGR